MLPTHTARGSDEWQQCTGNKAVTRGAREGAARRDRLHAAAKAKKNYENYVGRPSKSCQNSDMIIERVKTLCQNSDKARVLLARTGVGNAQICSTEFCGTNRLLARAGVGALPQISEGTRRLPGEVLQGSRSGVGLVPVAVNEYSPQKCRCKTGASPVRAGDREVSPGPVMSRARRRRITTARDHRGHTSSGRSTGRRRRSARTRSCKMPRWQIICQRVVLLSASPAPLPSFRDPFQGADPITSDQYCRVPEYGRPPPVGWSPNRVRSGRLPIRSHPINPIRSSPAGGVRELHGSGRCTLPFRGGNIKGRPAGGGPGFFRDGRHVSG